MNVIRSITELRAELDGLRAEGRSIGFVPTMGYLHGGHQSLMAASAAANDVTFASIFVNPLQFAADEDLDDYPRDLDRDVSLASDVGVSIVFAPTVEEMYPTPIVTTVEVPAFAANYEGATRPTHFAGVATVVTKLLSIAGTCRAYFGEKDFQQLAIIQRLAHDLSIPVEVVGCPIVREDDGLAMSSRNLYLSERERSAATVLYKSLTAVAASGERSPNRIVEHLASLVHDEPLARLDYAAIVDPATFEPPKEVRPGDRLLVTAQFGRPRLLDNMAMR